MKSFLDDRLLCSESACKKLVNALVGINSNITTSLYAEENLSEYHDTPKHSVVLQRMNGTNIFDKLKCELSTNIAILAERYSRLEVHNPTS